MIASVGLDRDHPLWQVWFVEGLATGHVAYVAKVHHALADGMSSARLLADIGSRAFRRHPDAGIDRSRRRTDAGTRERCSGGACATSWRWFSAFRHCSLRTWRYSRALRTRSRAGEPRGAKPFAGPHTRFDRPLTPNRVVRVRDVRARRHQVGRARRSTRRVTDVVAAMVSGALRRYLERHGELPDTIVDRGDPGVGTQTRRGTSVGKSRRVVVRLARDRHRRSGRTPPGDHAQRREPRVRSSKRPTPSCSTGGPSTGGSSG